MIFNTLLLKTKNKESVDDQYENFENDYFNFNEVITPNHYIGNKPRETILM